jgi:hypothetical protein
MNRLRDSKIKMSNRQQSPARPTNSQPKSNPSAAEDTTIKKTGRAVRAPRSGSSSSGAKAPAPAATRQKRAVQKYEYDVCLSFAGEDRAYVNRVVGCLKRRGVRYFYDNEAKADLWGKDLYTYLDEIYRHRSRFCLVFASKHYAQKKWTNHERQSAQARVFTEMGDYLLPVRLDDTDIPGIRPTLGYIDGRTHTPSQIADHVCAKIKGRSATSSTKSAVKSSTKTPQAKTPKATPGSRTKVSSSGKWIMLGEHFFVATLVEEGANNNLSVHISPQHSAEEAELRSIAARPSWHRTELAYAHGNDAAQCQIQDTQIRTVSGKTTFIFQLNLIRPHANAMEINYQNMTADQIAEKRARLILLNEKPGTGERFLDSHIEHDIEAGILAKTWKLFQGDPSCGQKARLVALYHLLHSEIVQFVYTLSLGPITNAGITVHFEGRRAQQYSNQPPIKITITGICPQK